MANDLSAWPARRRHTGPTGERGERKDRARRAVPALAAALVVMSWLVPAAALGADGLQVTTPYPGVAVAPGEDVKFDLSIKTATPSRVDLALQQVPQGWTATLRGGGFVVDGVQTAGTEPATASVELTVPEDATGNHQVVVHATSGSLVTDLPLTLRIEPQAAGEVSLTTTTPSLKGASNATFPFKLQLKNDTPEDLTFSVTADPPEGWQATTKVTGQEQVASSTVEAGGNVSVDVDVTPPQNAGAGAVTIPVTATSGAQTVNTELQVEIIGSYSMTLSTPDDRLNVSGTAGSEIRQTLVVENTGTAPLEGLKLSQSNAPNGWTVTFDPAEVPAVEAGKTANVTAIIKPSGDAIAGDYQVSIEASNANANATQQLRVTVETSLLWGIIGVALIVAVLAGLWFVFQRYGRR
jgi:uncharacterized membrane protein